jgi:hypothetical protein
MTSQKIIEIEKSTAKISASNSKYNCWLVFLAYFLEYAIVRISSIYLSVCRPHYYFSWGCPIGAIYGSIDSL